MFVPFHHHLKSWNENAPGYVTSSELGEHSLVDVIISYGPLSSFLCISLMEAKRLRLGFVLCHRLLAVSLPSLRFFPQEVLVERLSSAFGDFSWLYLFCQMFLKILFLSSNFFLEPDLPSRFSFVWILQEIKENRNGDVVFAFASLGHHILLVN